MKDRLVFNAWVWEALDDHLRSASPSEDGGFLLIRSGRGQTSRRVVVHDLLLPQGEDSWESRGQHNLRPSGQWLSAAIGAAIEAGSGLAFIHSHPNADHPSELSWIDQKTSRDWARTVVPTLDRPFATLVWTPRDITGWFFGDANSEPEGFDLIESLGRRSRRVLHGGAPPISRAGDLDDRQQRALGDLGNARLRDLSVALVGLGGTGSPLAEILGRMGVSSISLIDPDVIDTPSNLRRLVGATFEDLRTEASKADVAHRHLTELAFVDHIDASSSDVRNEDVARGLLDVDLVISTTDTHSSRALLNQLAMQYYVPVIDVGVVVGTAIDGRVSGMPIDVRLLLPDEACLWCRGILDPARIRAENLPPEERERLIAEGYVQGIDGPQPSLAALNFLAASLAAMAALQLVAERAAPDAGYVLDPWEGYIQAFDFAVDANCVCARWRGRADEEQLAVL